MLTLITNKFYIIAIPTLIVLSLLTLYPAFNLALFGDDWLTLLRYFQYLGPKSSGEWNHLSYFLTSYGPQDITMGLLQKIYGNNSLYYQLTSYTLRLIASFSIYPLALYLTKDKLSSFFAVLFLSVTTIGLETTNWVFNMPSYIAIIFLNLFLYFYLRLKKEQKIKLLIPSGLFLFAAMTSQPIRMHGLIPFILIMELFWLFTEHTFKMTRQTLTRLGFLAFIFTFIFWALSRSPVASSFHIFGGGVKAIVKLLNEGRNDFLFNPIISLGSIFLPEPLFQIHQVATSTTQVIFKLLLPAFLIASLIFIVLAKNIVGSIAKPQLSFLLPSSIWSLVVVFIYQHNQVRFSNANYIILLLIGGYIIIAWILLLIKFSKDRGIATALIFSFGWLIFSYLIAWWRSPESVFFATHRYLIVSAVGASLLLTSLVNLGKFPKNRVILSFLLLVITLLNIFSTHKYLQEQILTHGSKISDKIWISMPYISEVGKSIEPLVFYFEDDGSNAVILRDVVTFGFPPHMALLYGVTEENRTPIPMGDWREVESAVLDGKSFASYGHPLKPISPERVYAFHLQGQDNLINITNLAREKLRQLK